MGRAALSATRLDKPLTLQNISDGAWSREADIRMPRGQIVQELERAPARMRLSGFDYELLDRFRRLVRAVIRGPRAVAQAFDALLTVATQPLVAGLTADTKSLAELGHREKPFLPGKNEFMAFGHGIGLSPRHGSSRL